MVWLFTNDDSEPNAVPYRCHTDRASASCHKLGPYHV